MRRAALAACVLGVIAVVAAPQTAFAHGGSTSAPQVVTTDVGGLQIKTVLGVVDRVPGSMLIDVELTGPARAETVFAVRAWPTTAARPAEPAASIRLLPGDVGPYPTQVRIDRAGPWEIELALPAAGGRVVTSRIPVTVPVPVPESGEPARSIIYASAGVLALAGVGVVVATRRRAPRLSGVAARATPLAVVAALAAGVTLSVVPLAPPAPAVPGQAANATTLALPGRAEAPAASLPHVAVLVRTLGGAPIAGRRSVLELDLVDGSTGRPVDDVAPHHEALIHLALTGPTSADFAHLHPARVGPGRYQVEWTPAGPGGHDLRVEVTRAVPGRVADVGSQVVERRVVVTGRSTPSAGAGAPSGLGRHRALGMDVEITASGSLVAGAPVGLRANVTEGGKPVALSRWLAMEGHLMIRNQRLATFAHVHAVGPMAPAPRLAGVATTGATDPIEAQLSERIGGASAGAGRRGASPSGPSGDSTVDFAYTFPAGGEYDAWLQFRRGGDVVTVPIRLTVAP